MKVSADSKGALSSVQLWDLSDRGGHTTAGAGVALASRLLAPLVSLSRILPPLLFVIDKSALFNFLIPDFVISLRYFSPWDGFIWCSA